MFRVLIQNRKLKVAIVTLCRLLLGITFVVFGFLRACNPVLGASMVNDYLAAANMSFFQPLSTLLTIVFSATEFAIGICSLLGTNIRKTSLYTVILLGFLTPFSFYTAYVSPVAANHQITGLPSSDSASFWMYFISLVTAILIFIWREYSKSIFSDRTEWAIGPISLAFSICVSLLSYVKLPMVDLSPYRAGVSLTHFVTDKKLTQENVRWNSDDVLEINEVSDVIGPKGNSLPALQIYSEKEGDITQTIVGTKGYTFLLIAEDLQDASTVARHEINDIFDYARENGYSFYCLTATKASSDIAEEYCVESGGAEYTIVNADKRVLSNMIQSNPGLILIKDGIIYKKWSCFNMPSFEGKLEEDENASLQTLSMRRKFISLLGDFAIILIIILALDKFIDLIKWIWKKSRTGDSNAEEMSKGDTEAINKLKKE